MILQFYAAPLQVKIRVKRHPATSQSLPKKLSTLDYNLTFRRERGPPRIGVELGGIHTTAFNFVVTRTISKL